MKEISFAGLLRRHRREADLTQEELAERAGLSVRLIGNLERGERHVPRKETIQLLADALRLSAEERTIFARAARRSSLARVSAGAPSSTSPMGAGEPGDRHLPIGGFLGALPGGKLVAREAELERILRVADVVERGEGRLVLLAGEPGIGKTRLAQEVSLHLWRREFLVAMGRCYEPQQAVPFYPFLDALATAYVAAPVTIQEHAGLRWPYLARLLPDHLDDSSVVSSDRPEEQQRLFRAVTAFLVAVTRIQPVALLVDDLQWADTATLELLLHLARHSRSERLLLLGTYCDVDAPRGHPLMSALHALRREDLVEQMTIGPLGTEGIAGLVEVTLGEAEVPEGLVRLVHQHTEGNPFFALEVVRTLSERGHNFHESNGSESQAAAEIAIPTSVRDAIVERVSRLGAQTDEVLYQASVLGQTFTFEDLRELGRRSEGALDEALAEATRIGLIRSTGRDRFAFNHALTQQVLYAELSPWRRRRLHLAAGEALEGTPSRSRMAELAWHFTEGGDRERALKYAMSAGDEAEAVFAHQDAERQYRIAWRLAQEVDEGAGQHPSLHLQAEAMEKLGIVLANMARYDEALRVLEGAAHLHRARLDGEGLARVEARIASIYANRGTRGEVTQAVERLERLLETLGDCEPSHGLAMLYVALAHLHFSCGHYRKELDVARRAAEIARAAGDERIVAAAEARHGRALRNMGRYEEALGVLEATIPMAEAVNDLDSLCLALGDAGALYQARGELRRSGQYLERGLEVAERLGDPVHSAHMLASCAMNAFLIGDWPQSRLWVYQAESRISRVGVSWVTGYCLVGPGVFRWLDGEGEPALRYLQECIPIAGQSNDLVGLSIALWFLAESDLLEHRPERVVARIDALLHQYGLQEADLTILLPMLAWAHLQLGDADRAAALVEKATTWMTAGGDRLWLVDGLRVHAMLASQCGRAGEAEEVFHRAAALAEGMPCPFFEARVLREWGMVDAQQGSLPQARQRLGETLEIYRRLGAMPYVEQTERALAGLP